MQEETRASQSGTNNNKRKAKVIEPYYPEDVAQEQVKKFKDVVFYLEECEPLPTERWKLRRRLREAKHTIWCYDEDEPGYDLERGGCDEHYYHEHRAVKAIEFLLTFIPRDDAEDDRLEREDDERKRQERLKRRVDTFVYSSDEWDI